VLLSGIGESAFRNCSGLTSIVLPKGVTKIGESAFANCSGLTSTILPESVTEIGVAAFANCSGLTAIVLPEGVTEIGSGAFYGCSGLTSILLPKGVTEIKSCAFAHCSGLTTVVLPEGVTKIGEDVFHGCPWLVVVTLHSPFPMDVASGAFDSCGHLTLMVAPRTSRLVGTVVGGVTVVEDTVANRRLALNLQYWSTPTRGLCSPSRRSWVLAVLLVASRLLGGPFALPREMWYAILGAIRRCELGPNP
jgi:hypothetical protein